jgi:hypothetical protein
MRRRPFVVRGCVRSHLRAFLRACAIAIGAAGSLGAVAQVGVSDSGTPTYSLPIGVPPGIAGMAPNIGLVYGGGGVNGPVGHGWSIQGISTITRCPGNKAIDGAPRAVDYTSGDKLCLDGQRLIQTDASGSITSFPQSNDSLGGTGLVREFRTERDSFARIRAYEAAGGNANGPAYFKVWTKSGQIYEYGLNANTNASSNAAITAQGKTIVAAWAVSRISDTLGNYVDFQYEQRDVAWGSGAAGNTFGREWNLVEIRYTGTTTQQPVNRVVFEYTDRPDAPGNGQDRTEAYHQGSKNVSVRRLAAVRTFINWPANVAPWPAAPPSGAIKVKTTKLTYDQGPLSKRSRVKQVQECAGSAESPCLPPTTFDYSAGGGEAYAANSAFAGSLLATMQLTNTTSILGTITADFDGDGKTDIILWSNVPSANRLYTSNGDGSFTEKTNFNITDQNLFKSDGCYFAYAIDFNGDGVTDLLRYRNPTNTSGQTCPAGDHYIYLSQHDGTFNRITIPPTIALGRKVVTKTLHCPNGSGCDPLWVWSSGAKFHLLDVDGDGITDIITSVFPGASSDDGLQGCPAGGCTHVYLGDGAGGFAEIPTNLTNTTVYSDPGKTGPIDSLVLNSDLNGDGLADISAPNVITTGSTRWISLGNGNFSMFVDSGTPDCGGSADFNGDGRPDCLIPGATASGNQLRVSTGSGPVVTANFNLTGVGHELVTPSGSTMALGMVTLDIDGDGRTDVLRWGDDPTKNTLYLSNGDGSFRASSAFNWTGTGKELKKGDGTYDFAVGDFTGHGQVEILAMRASGPNVTPFNQLLLKSDATPADLLIAVTGPTGLKTDLTWVSLPNSSSGGFLRYSSDREGGVGVAAQYPKVDITPPMHVVVTTAADSGVTVGGVQQRITTEFKYFGLKSIHGGRGGLGFREVHRQAPAADGTNLTVVTQYLQAHPYIGSVRKAETFVGSIGALAANPLSRSEHTYCDTTSTADPTLASSSSPCLTSAKIQRPYLYKSVEEGWELPGNPSAVLPTVITTNTFNDWGDPTQIVVATNGNVLAGQTLNQVVTKTTTNVYKQSETGGDNWILGRLEKATQRVVVPDSLGNGIATSEGTAPFATAIQGNPPALSLTGCTPTSPTTTPTSATLSCTLSNSGPAPIGAISYSNIAGVTITGPTTCGANASCGTVTATTATAAGTYAGTLTATPNSGNAASTAVNLQVRTQPALALSGCTANSPTNSPTAATLTCTLSNSGQTATSSISYSSAAGTTASGPTGVCAGGTTCGTVTVTSSTAAGTYSGTLTATPNIGSAGSTSINLTVNTPAALAFSGCSTTSPTTSPTAATMTCSLVNGGQTAISSISYNTAPGTTVSGPTGACGANATCGTVTVTTATAASLYSGTLTATPNTGSAASVAVSLTVRTPAVLSLTACANTSPTTAPTAATQTCTVSNTGQTPVNSISYSTAANTTVSGPTGACNGGATCGTVTVTTSTAAGTYSGTLTATPNTGTAASIGVNLTVRTPAALSFGSCNSTSPTTPTAATLTCALSNTGQTPIGGISYSSAANTSVSGPSSCGANQSCGNVVVTTGTAAANYSGTLWATPNTGSAASTTVNLTVLTPPALSLSGCSGNSPTTTPAAATLTCTVSNTGQTPLSSISYSTAPSTTVSGPTGSCGGGSTCGTVTVTSSTAAGTYTGTLTATPNSGSAASTSVNLTVRTPPALAFSGCTSNSPTTTPTAATLTCTLSNTGQTPLSSISYSTAPSTTVSGPTGACSGNAACGTVTVTSGTAVATYSGTLTATPNTGSAASQPVSLVVNTGVALFTYVNHSVTATTTTSQTIAFVFRNDNAAGVQITARAAIGDAVTVSSSSTCVVGNTLAAGATCSVIVTATRIPCEGQGVNATLSNIQGTRSSAVVVVPGRTPPGGC